MNPNLSYRSLNGFFSVYTSSLLTAHGQIFTDDLAYINVDNVSLLRGTTHIITALTQTKLN